MDNSNDLTIKAEFAEIRHQLLDVINRMSKSEGAIEQLNRSIAAGNRMTNWQFIGFVVVMAGTLFGTLYWATGVLERRLDQFDKTVNTRFELMDKRIDQVEKRMDARFDDMDKRFEDMNKRFEDLKQVVISKR